jgi:acylphosphatase
MKITRRLVIHGQVQGVGYRYAMVAVARRLGVTGWVRNRSDGSVEAMIQAAPASISHLSEWAQRGPAGASVKGIDIFQVEAAETFTNFVQMPTL